MKHQERFCGITAIALALTACGGGGTAGTDTTSSTPTPVNVALVASGASVSASYGGVTANFVNDGDISTTTNYWAGNVAGDTVTIDFGRLRNIAEVSVYTNDTSFNSASPAKYIEISSDGLTWKTTAQLLGGDVGCPTYSAGSGRIRCVFAAVQSARYFRVRVTAVSPGAQQIVEMEAVGS